MKHWLITGILVASAAFGGYAIGCDHGARTMSQSMSDAAAKSRAEIRARFQRDLKACAEGERGIPAGNKNPPTVCQLHVYMRAVGRF